MKSLQITLQGFAVLFALCLCIPACKESERAGEEKPNIIFILTDDQRDLIFFLKFA